MCMNHHPFTGEIIWKQEPLNTFVHAGHLFCFGRGIFYLAVVVEEKRLLLLKKVIDFLREHSKGERNCSADDAWTERSSAGRISRTTFIPEIRTSSADFTMFLKNPPNISLAFFLLTLS